MPHLTTSIAALTAVLILTACSPATTTDTETALPVSSAPDTRVKLNQQNLFAIRDVLLERARTARPDEEYPTIDAESEEEFDLSKQAEATEVRPYESIFFGISFDVPYNPQWLNETYMLPPTYEDQLNGEVSFGPLVYDWHGNAFYRGASVRIIGVRTAEAALQAAEESEFLVADFKPAIKTIGDKTVVSYSEEPPESAAMNMVEIIGPSSNYLLSSADMSLTELEKIVESVEFMEKASPEAAGE